MSEKKRQRAPNYSSREKEVLLSIALKHKNVIENKKTDAVSVNDKKLAWFKITQEFNSVSPNNCFRETESLKKYYENMKEDIRKRAGEQRQTLYKTGGGPPSPMNNDKFDDLLLGLVNKKTIYGIANPFDSDKIVNIPGMNEEMAEEESTIEIVFDDGLTTPSGSNEAQLATQSDAEMADFTTPTTGLKDVVKDKSKCWARVKPSDMATPLDEKLEANLIRTYTPMSTQNKVKKRQTNSARRRPTTVRVLSSSALGEKYETLLEKKYN